MGDSKKTETNKGKVVVAMSGGVDSSVAAALLQLQGYDVVGMTVQTFDAGKEEKLRFDSCCSISDISDARRVCDTLGVPHYVINGVGAFEAKVIDYFVAEYLQGRTPNPCVLCNNTIKFDYLMERALELGADYVATGHYARSYHNQQTGRYNILKAVDETKDQSYFLFGLTQEQVSRTILPLGSLTKTQVRKLAEEFGFVRVAHKPDSQEICFIGNEGYAKFIENRVGSGAFATGTFELPNGVTLGRHDGIHHYTIGQKKGLPEDAQKQIQKLGFDGGSLCVTKVDPSTGTIRLGSEQHLLKTTLIADRFNWMSDLDFTNDRKVLARIRSRHKESPAIARLYGGGRVLIRFEEAQRAITPGQAVVLYSGDEVLGGGWIENIIEEKEGGSAA